MSKEMEELPEGWVAVPLAEVVDLNPRKPSSDELAADAPVTFLGMASVDERGFVAERPARPFGEVRKGYTYFADGDVILAKITPCFENGKAAIVSQLENGIGFGSTEFHVLRPSSAVLASYLFHYLHQPAFRESAKSHMTGTAGQARVPADYLRQHMLPLPPLAEQKRIVAKVEELLAQVEATKAHLAKIPTLLKRFRQSLLAAACSGRLTESWRDGTSDFKEWQTVELRDLAILITKGASPKWQGFSYVGKERGTLFVTSENIREMKLDVSSPKYVDTGFNEVSRRSMLQEGDLLTNIVGASIGRTAIYDLKSTANINQAVCLVRLKPEVNRRFLLFVLSSPHVLDAMHVQKVDVARANLSLDDVGGLQIAMPSQPEQKEIVRRVEVLLELADTTIQVLSAESRKIETTVSALLAKAFRGELVPTETELARREGRSYESASDLLARIATAEPTPASAPKSKRAKRPTKPTLTPSAKRSEARS